MSDPHRSVVARARRFALALARRGARLRLAQTAASLAFLSLLAIVPVFTIAISLLGALPVFAGLRDALLAFVGSNLFLPSFSGTLVRYLDQFAAKAGELSLIGSVVFFATAFSTLLTIDGTFNRIWEAARPRSLARRLTIYWTFLTLGPLLVAGSVAVNGVIVSDLLSGVPVPGLRRAWLALLPWVSTVGGLTLLYRLVPNAPVRWRDALAGALVAAVLLELLKRGMAFQAVRLPTYTVVYGAFAALPLLLVWLFLLWLTVLGGALVAASARHWVSGDADAARESAARRFDEAAGVLERLAAARGGDARAALQAGELRALFDGDASRATRAAQLLCALGYLDRYWRAATVHAGDAEPAIWEETWMLADGATARTLRPLFECIWRALPPRAPDPHERLDLSRIDRPIDTKRVDAV